MLKIIILLLILPLSSLGDSYPYKILRVIDGDTIEFEAHFLPPPLKPSLSLRIYGIDTPEKTFRAKCELEAGLGREATEFVKNRVAESKFQTVIIKSWDKFGGRVLGDVLLDGVSLRQTLLAKGYAHVYFGEKKQSWCHPEEK